MKTIEEYISGIVAEFNKDPYVEASKECIDCIELPDGRRAQITIEIETDPNRWMPMRNIK